MEINISPMTIKDLEEIAPILLSDFDDFWTISTLALEINNPNTIYIVAKLNDEIVGFAGIWQILDEIHLNNIVVKKSKRNLGIGTYLLNSLIKLSTKKNATVLTLEVNQDNYSAIHLYEKSGFKVVGCRKNYYPNQKDAILMSLFFTT